jgi:hypothetical protein
VVRYSVSASVLTLKTANQPSRRPRKNTSSVAVPAAVRGPMAVNE